MLNNQATNQPTKQTNKQTNKQTRIYIKLTIQNNIHIRYHEHIDTTMRIILVTTTTKMYIKQKTFIKESNKIS